MASCRADPQTDGLPASGSSPGAWRGSPLSSLAPIDLSLSPKIRVSSTCVAKIRRQSTNSASNIPGPWRRRRRWLPKHHFSTGSTIVTTPQHSSFLPLRPEVRFVRSLSASFSLLSRLIAGSLKMPPSSVTSQANTPPYLSACLPASPTYLGGIEQWQLHV